MHPQLGTDNAWPLPRPRPAELERALRQLADRLGDQGERAMRRAMELSARGYAASTNGSEGGRSSDRTSSTERAALNPESGPFDGIDYRMRTEMFNLWTGIVFLHATLDVVAQHKCNDKECHICADEIPPGTGPCAVEGCDHICNPRKNPNDRLRAGYCRRHYMRWLRLGRPDRGLFERFTETEDVA